MYLGKKHGFTRIMGLLLTLSILLSTAAVAAEEPDIPSVTAASAIVIDYDTGEVLYEKDADTMRVPASMTKVMTAYIIFEELEAGNLTLDTMVSISDENAQKSRDGKSYPASVPLPAGSSVSVDTLLKLILVPSASASCIVMAEYISGSEEAFVQRMNETAKRLGMTAEFENSHGAHVHYLTARSQATLVREFISRFPQILYYTSLTGVTFNGKWYPNTNKLLPGLDYAYDGVDGFKTGTISAAGYCLSATAVKNGRRIISVVMKSSNDKTRHTDTAALLGLVSGTGESTFAPDQPITRQEMMTIIDRCLDPPDENGLGFSDDGDIAFWALEAAARTTAAGLFQGGNNNELMPLATSTRAEAATVVSRITDLL